MRILMVTDKENSAIWRLAQGVKKYNPQHHIDVIAVHPKRPDSEQLAKFTQYASQADILDFEYWKTYVKLREIYPELMDKPKMLAHYNPYNLFEQKWEEFKVVTVCNKDMERKAKKIKNSIYVPLTIDIEKFPFSRDYTKNKIVLMVTSRIEGKKGVLPVAEVCKRLGYKMLLVGSISDRDYFDRVMETGMVDFRQNISDEDLLKAYQESAILVCNSIDDYESGTLPILEAMCVGVPVLTRNIGHVPDINNEKNMVVRKGDTDDIEDLEKELKSLMENEQKRLDLRENAWVSAKIRDDVRRARDYERIWYSMILTRPLVSVIIPTFNRKENLIQIIESILAQDYPAIELIITDDGSTDGTRELILGLRDRINFPIKYVNTETSDEYNLSLARNLGVIESIGEILIFCDDRYKGSNNFVLKFVENMKPKRWLYGNKGTGKKSFVENFSCIYRNEFIVAGMFNTSVKIYGFLTQETRERFRCQGFKFYYVDDAKAETISGSKAKYKKKDEIRRAKNILYKMGF